MKHDLQKPRQATPTVDQPPYPDTGDDISVSRDFGSAPSTPRWVKVFGIIAIFLALLIVVMLLTGHGPGRHM